MLKVCKFGGSSLCDSAAFARVGQLVLSDPARRVVIVSAAGRRHVADHKITNLLYLCHAHLQYGVSCQALWRRVVDRYVEIRDGCGLSVPVERIADGLYAELSPHSAEAQLVSRGEYLCARLMADLLDFTFIDAAEWLHFDAAGRVQREASYAALRSLADGRKIVTPGFYGAAPDGSIRTLPRGGSDVTGALCAAALGADVYENWTDVPGVLAADPAIVPDSAPVAQLSYDALAALSHIGLQVLHEDAVAPVRQARIVLRICSTHEPELPGTLVRPHVEPERWQVCFAGRRGVALLRLRCAQTDALVQLLTQAGLAPLCVSALCGEAAALVPVGQATAQLHHVADQLRTQHSAQSLVLRENLSVLAALCPNSAAAAALVLAMEEQGVAVQAFLKSGALALMAVNDSQYAAALRAAYAASCRLQR